METNAGEEDSSALLRRSDKDRGSDSDRDVSALALLPGEPLVDFTDDPRGGNRGYSSSTYQREVRTSTRMPKEKEEDLLTGDCGQRTTDLSSSTITLARGNIEENRAQPRSDVDRFADVKCTAANETVQRGLVENYLTVKANITPELSLDSSSNVPVCTKDLGATSFEERPFSHFVESDNFKGCGSALSNIDQKPFPQNLKDADSQTKDNLGSLKSVDITHNTDVKIKVIFSDDSHGFCADTLIAAFCELAGASLTGAGLSAIWVLTATPGHHLAVWWTIPSAALAWSALRASLLCSISETKVSDLSFGLAGSAIAALAGPFACSLGYTAPIVVGVSLSCAGAIWKGMTGSGLAGAGLTLISLTSARLVGEMVLRCINRDWRVELSFALFGLSLAQVIGIGFVGTGISWASLSRIHILEKHVTATELLGAGLTWAGMALCGEVIKDGAAWTAPIALTLTGIRALGYRSPLFGIAGAALAGVFLTQKMDDSISESLASAGVLSVGLGIINIPAGNLAMAGLIGSGLAGYLTVNEGCYISMLTGLGIASVGLGWVGMEWIGQIMRNRGTDTMNKKRNRLCKK